MTGKNNNGCGTKRLKLIGIVFGVLIPLVLGLGSWMASSLAASEARADSARNEQEVRLRAVEQQGARVEERLKAIQQTLARIEKRKSAR